MTKTQGKLDALDDVLGGSRMRHSYAIEEDVLILEHIV